MFVVNVHIFSLKAYGAAELTPSVILLILQKPRGLLSDTDHVEVSISLTA